MFHWFTFYSFKKHLKVTHSQEQREFENECGRSGGKERETHDGEENPSENTVQRNVATVATIANVTLNSAIEWRRRKKRQQNKNKIQ